MTTSEAVQRGRVALLSEELRRIEAALGDGSARNCDGHWCPRIARMNNRLRIRQAAVKQQLAVASGKDS